MTLDAWKAALLAAMMLGFRSALAAAAPAPAAPAKAASPAATADEDEDGDEEDESGAKAKELMFRISFKLKAEDLESSGNFVVQDGSQSNYVLGGDVPVEAAGSGGPKAVELKRHGTIVNCLPAQDPDKPGWANVQCQFELSGPLGPVGALQARPTVTFQLQTEFRAELGKTLVLVDESRRRIEVKVEEYKRPKE